MYYYSETEPGVKAWFFLCGTFVATYLINYFIKEYKSNYGRALISFI